MFNVGIFIQSGEVRYRVVYNFDAFFLLQGFQQRHVVAGYAVVVSELGCFIVGVRPYQRYFSVFARQGQQVSVVFQQHHRLPCHLQCLLLVRTAFQLALRNVGVRHLAGRVEHAQAKPYLQQFFQRDVYLVFGDQSGFYSLSQGAVYISAFQIRAVQHSVG